MRENVARKQIYGSCLHMEWAQRNSHVCREKRRRIKRVNRRSISATQGSSPYEMPEVCQCVMSAHGCCHHPGNNKPLPLHQPGGLLDESPLQRRYGWEQGRLFTLYGCMRMCVCVWGRQWRCYLLTKFPWGLAATVTNSSPLSFSGQARCLTRLTGLNPYQCVRGT